MDLGLRGKVAVVAGSSRGIGKAIAVGLAGEGCQVVLCAREAGVLERTAEGLRGVVVFLCSERASWVAGACIPVDGGQARSNIWHGSFSLWLVRSAHSGSTLEPR